MTEREAYKILGISPGTPSHEIKKRYRQLIMQVHPDIDPSSDDRSTYQAQKINTAYSLLKKTSANGDKAIPRGQERPTPKQSSHAAWDAPVNKNAYMEREILHCVEDRYGTALDHFCIARGKYLWTPEEDLPLFLLSIYKCSEQLLDKIDAQRRKEPPAAARQKLQAELTYLLAQQFIDGSSLLKEFTREETADGDGNRIFYVPAMLEPSDTSLSLDKGETLYPSGIRRHRLYLEKRSGQGAGYLSFPDDRLYYIAVPLFEQKKVRVRIQAAGKRYNLHLWIKLLRQTPVTMPESLDLQIDRVLDRYRLLR